MFDASSIYQRFKDIDLNTLFDQLIQFGIWFVFILVLTWLIQKAVNRSITGMAARYRTKKAIRFISYILIVILAIVTFTGKAQYFSLTIGLISAGIAFALQEVVLSIAGWVAIYASNIYKPGDRIEINGIKGDVIDIGMTKTTLMEVGVWISSDNYSGRIVQVSNSNVFKTSVHNYSTDFPFLWDEINLPIEYGSDVNEAFEILEKVTESLLLPYARTAAEEWKRMTRKYLIEKANVEPTVSMKLTDNWIEFNIRYVVDYKQRRGTKGQVYRELYERILGTNGKVTLASATFGITDMPELDVRMNKDDQK